MLKIPEGIRSNPVLIFSGATMLVAALIFSALGIYKTTASLDEVIATSTPDDSYYYLLPALNFKTHGYFTFDGENPTYGFQPLWMVTLSVFGVFFESRMGFLRGVISLQYLLHAASAVLLFFFVLRLARRMDGNLKYFAALTAGLLLLFHPTYLQAAVTAKENALYVLLLIFSLFPLTRLLQEPDARPRDFILAAVLISLSVLTRIIASTVLIGLAMAVIIYMKGRGHRWRIAAAFSTAPLLWFAYAWFSFGFLFPVSGSQKLKPFLDSLASGEFWTYLPRVFEMTFSYIGEYGKFALGFGSTLLAFPSGLAGWPLLMGILKLILIPAAIIGILLRKDLAEKMPAAKTMLQLTLLVFASALLLPTLFVETWYHLFRYWNWYVVLAPVLTSLLAGLGLLALQGKGKYATIVAAAVASAVLYDSTVIATSIQPQREFTFNQASFWDSAYKAAVFTNEQLRFGPEVRVGSFNAGIIGYFTDCKVINLDGLANDNAFREIQQQGKSVIDYVQDQNIEFMIDWMPYGGFFGNFFAHYELVAVVAFVPEAGPPGISIVQVTDEPFPPPLNLPETAKGEQQRISFLRARRGKVFDRFDNKLIRLRPKINGATSLSFRLDGLYRELHCFAGVWPDQPVNDAQEVPLDIRIDVLGDGKPIHSFPISSSSNVFQEINLDLSNIQTLEFRASTSMPGEIWNQVYLAGMQFIPIKQAE